MPISKYSLVKTCFNPTKKQEIKKDYLQRGKKEKWRGKAKGNQVNLRLSPFLWKTKSQIITTLKTFPGRNIKIKI